MSVTAARTVTAFLTLDERARGTEPLRARCRAVGAVRRVHRAIAAVRHIAVDILPCVTGQLVPTGIANVGDSAVAHSERKELDERIKSVLNRMDQRMLHKAES